MADIREGLELYNENRFEEAALWFCAFSEDAKNNADEREEAFLKLISIYDSLKNVTEKNQAERKYYAFLIEQKKCQEAVTIFDLLLQEVALFSIGEIQTFWFALVHSGNISRAIAIAEKYAGMLLSKKNFEKGLSFIQDVEKYLGEREMVFCYRVQFLYLKKDYASLKKVFDESFSLLLESKDYRKNKFLSLLVDFLGHQGEDQNVDYRKYVFRAMLLRAREQLSEDRILRRRKRAVHHAINVLLDNPLDASVFETLLQYSDFFKRKKLASIFVASFPEMPREVIQNKKIKKQITKIQAESSLWPDAIKRTEKDNRKNDKKKSSSEVTRKKKETTQAGPIASTSFHFSPEVETSDRSERMLKSFFNYLSSSDNEYLKKHYRDLAAVFFSFNAPDLACDFLNEIRVMMGKDENWTERLGVEYLYVVALEMANKNYEALIVLDEVLNSFPVMDEEKICFHYLKGEIFQKMGKTVSALSSFRYIEARDPHYRNVKQRIKELAKS